MEQVLAAFCLNRVSRRGGTNYIDKAIINHWYFPIRPPSSIVLASTRSSLPTIGHTQRGHRSDPIALTTEIPLLQDNFSFSFARPETPATMKATFTLISLFPSILAPTSTNHDHYNSLGFDLCHLVIESDKLCPFRGVYSHVRQIRRDLDSCLRADELYTTPASIIIDSHQDSSVPEMYMASRWSFKASPSTWPHPHGYPNYGHRGGRTLSDPATRASSACSPSVVTIARANSSLIWLPLKFSV